MNFFPITSVNNFFNDPDELVKYTKKLDYKTNINKTDGSWPGVRTDNLYKAQGDRTDRLYEMFIDLVKEKK